MNSPKYLARVQEVADLRRRAQGQLIQAKTVMNAAGDNLRRARRRYQVLEDQVNRLEDYIEGLVMPAADPLEQ